MLNADREHSKQFYGILLLWGVLDLLCAMFCEIHADEAYYRLYGQFLSWGYFDHPPMVGLMTALSASMVPATSLILKNLSVRLVTVLMHMATVYVVWKTLPKSPTTNHQSPISTFILLSASMPMFCAYGFMTTPDAPLLFFAALFYYAYRRFTMAHTWSMSVLLGIAAVLMIPHLWWQYANAFPSFTYHLVARATSYQPLYTLEFLPNQWAVFNPIVWALMIWVGARQLRSDAPYRRSLAMTILGFQVFFLISAFRGHVEPHWTMVTSIPAILLLADEHFVSRRGIRIALGVCVGLVLAARIILMLNILPAQTGLAHKQAFYEQLHKEAQGLPVVFDGSFQAPSLYRFFYDDQAVLVRTATDRYTQFDLLHLEKDWIGKPACVRRKGQVYFTDHLTEEDLRE